MPSAFIPPRLALPRRPKHDGYPMMARRRNGHDWTEGYPLVVEAVNHRKVRSCLIDGEVVCCDARGLATFQLLRHRRNEPHALLYAFDLLELNGTDLRREPIEVRKATLASLLPQSRHGVRLNEHGSASPGAWRQCPRSRVGRRAGKPSARSRALG